jgi:hypothetical protein
VTVVTRIAEVLGVVVALAWLLRPVVQWIRTRKRGATAHLRSALVLLVLGMASASEASVVWSQTWDSISTGAQCTGILAADSTITGCRYDYDPGRLPDISYVEVVTSITGHSGSFPSGSKVLLTRHYGATVQGDPTIGIGDASSSSYDGYIPADHWGQIALYLNNTGAETSVWTNNRPFKLVYPCEAGPYPCQSGGLSWNYWLLQTVKNNSLSPFCDLSLGSETDGDMWIGLRDHDPNGHSSPNWAGYTGCTDITNPGWLGQTNLSERIRPGRWNIIRWHSRCTGGTCDFEAWIAPKGSAFVKVMDWRHGTTVEGETFTWTYTGSGSHRAVYMPSTRPQAGTSGDDTWMYVDDMYIATSESDLPTYVATDNNNNQVLMFVRTVVAWVMTGLSYAHLILIACWLWMQRHKAALWFSLYRYRQAVARWQAQAPVMLGDQSTIVDLTFQPSTETTEASWRLR